MTGPEEAGRAGAGLPRPDLRAFPGCRPLRPLAGGHRNQVWLAEGPQGLLVAKSTRRDQAQLHWLGPVHHAARAAGFIIPAPIIASGGLHAPQGWTLENFVTGRAASPADLAGLGPRLTDFHARTATLPQRPGFLALPDLLSQDQSGDIDLRALPPALITRLRHSWTGVADAPLGVIHGDLCPGNVILTDAGPALIDWDEARVDALFLDLTSCRPPPPAEARAHLALEIASCWQVEPGRARRLARAFTLSGSAPPPAP